MRLSRAILTGNPYRNSHKWSGKSGKMLSYYRASCQGQIDHWHKGPLLRASKDPHRLSRNLDKKKKTDNQMKVQLIQ